MTNRSSLNQTLTGGRRTSMLLMLSGGVLAVAAALLVFGISSRAQASSGEGRQAVAETMVVVAVKDIPEHTTIRPESVALKPFPQAYLPGGVAVKVEDVVGKVASTRIVRDQMVMSSLVAAGGRIPSATIPPEKVVFWMPLPDLLAQAGALRPGDRVDVLLSLALTPAAARSGGNSGQPAGLTTQTTLQNVEVYSVGASMPQPPADAGDTISSTANAANPGKALPKSVAFLVDPQDAVLAKFIKDSGGTVDLVLRPRDARDVLRTEAVTADTLVERYQFRVPDRWTVGR